MRAHLVAPSKWLALVVLVAALGLAGSAAPPAAPPDTYDIVIAGGRIVDGTGAPWFAGDVGIRGDRIVAIGNLKAAVATTRIDAANLVVAPGFIDLLGQSEFNVLVDNRAASKVLMGVTTEVTGEGSAIAPANERTFADQADSFKHFGVAWDWRSLADYFRRLDQRAHPAINLATFVGAGGLRTYVIGKADRPATAGELSRMQGLVAAAMQDGALGVSSSLQYMPDRFATTDELVALSSVAAHYGGVYFTHMRSESARIGEALDEVFAVAERAKIPAEIWHLKTAYKANWGRMPEVLAKIDAARARGLDITADQYPYTRAANGLDACLPLWVREGGTEKMLARLRNPADREQVKREMADPASPGWENQWYGSGGADGIMISSVLDPGLRKYEGMTLSAIGRQMGKDPRDAVMDLVIADKGFTEVVTSIMREDDVVAALKSPLVSICSDSGAKAEDGPLAESKTHPRAFGTFARILGRYVRDEKVLRLEEAIRKMTSQPAARVHLQDRGILRPGMAADVTVFDPAAIKDVATFENPMHYAVGVRYVLVNGRAVVADGKITSERPGRALKGPGAKK
jgi:dihydroorotase/N-acyl-D-amino-acid deacylase